MHLALLGAGCLEFSPQQAKERHLLVSSFIDDSEGNPSPTLERGTIISLRKPEDSLSYSEWAESWSRAVVFSVLSSYMECVPKDLPFVLSSDQLTRDEFLMRCLFLPTRICKA